MNKNYTDNNSAEKPIEVVPNVSPFAWSWTQDSTKLKKKYTEIIRTIRQIHDKTPDHAEKKAIRTIISWLNAGKVRCAVHYEATNSWIIQNDIIRVVSLFLSTQKKERIFFGGISYYDKVNLKFNPDRKKYQDMKSLKIRVVPGAIIRFGSFIGEKCVIMPSFINVGAYIGEGTMIDTWASIGSCAQIGKNCHISGGTGIGGLLEPAGKKPVIIEDNCFIGARSEIVEGMRICKGSVIAMGCFISPSTKIFDQTGTETEIKDGIIPEYSVVVPGFYEDHNSKRKIKSCCYIVKKVDEKTRARTSINEVLRS